MRKSSESYQDCAYEILQVLSKDVPFLFIYFWYVGYSSPARGLNSGLLHWDLRVLATLDHQGSPQDVPFLKTILIIVTNMFSRNKPLKFFFNLRVQEYWHTKIIWCNFSSRFVYNETFHGSTTLQMLFARNACMFNIYLWY